MNWKLHIERLQAGETTQFRPHGNSMRGKVKSGALCTVAPFTEAIAVGDIVVCRVKSNYYLHLVQAEKSERDGTSYLIGNNVGGTNGWVSAAAIYGKLIQIDP